MTLNNTINNLPKTTEKMSGESASDHQADVLMLFSLPVVESARLVNAQATAEFQGMIGRHLGNDLSAYDQFLARMKDLLLMHADVNAPITCDRPDVMRLLRCPPNGKNTALDFYLTLEEIYLKQAGAERTGEELSAYDESMNTRRHSLCNDIVHLLIEFGGKTAMQLYGNAEPR